MSSMKRYFKLIFVTGFFIFLPLFSLFAQSDAGCDPICNCRADGSICPIDNGLYILIGIGVLYGLGKAINLKKKGSFQEKATS